MKTTLPCLLFAGFLFAGAAQELIVNGSFENTGGTFVNNGQGVMQLQPASKVIPGWTTTTAELLWMNNTNAFAEHTPFGDFALELTGFHDSLPYGGVTQTVPTVPGQNYRLSLAVSANDDFPNAGGIKAVSVLTGASGATLVLKPTQSSGNEWGTFAYNFVASSNATPITIVGIVGGIHIGLDNVSVKPDDSPPVTSQNLVVNGSFENVAATWVNNGNGVMSLPSGSMAIPGWSTVGEEMIWGFVANTYGPSSPFGYFFLDLTGYHDHPPYAGVTQQLPTSPGQTYRLTFSVGADQANPAFAGPMSVSATVGSVDETFTFTPAGEGNQWGTFSLDFTADAAVTPLTLTGTASAGGQYLGLDNVQVVPVPGELRILTVDRAANQLNISFESLLGQRYALQVRDALGVGAWMDVVGSEQTGSGGVLTLTAPLLQNVAHQFFRVRTVP